MGPSLELEGRDGWLSQLSVNTAVSKESLPLTAYNVCRDLKRMVWLLGWDVGIQRQGGQKAIEYRIYQRGLVRGSHGFSKQSQVLLKV